MKTFHQSLPLRLVFSLLGLLLFGSLQAAILPHQSTTSLYDHLLEVNKEWAQQKVAWPSLCEPVYFENDRQRIQKHLQLVEQDLRSRSTDHWSAEQVKRRLHHLDVLQDYWQEGCFPVNHYHQVRQPYFVDDFGTACAVGYLLLEDGEETFVDRIVQENNYAYLHEMPYPELEAWATHNGFLTEELAWIQPGYPPLTQRWHAPGNGGGPNGFIHEILADEQGEWLYLVGEFTEVDGVAANGIIAWDGEVWRTLGTALEGVIHDLELGTDGQLYAAGAFTLNGTEANIASWDGQNWTPLQSGPMEGTIYTLTFYKNKLHIGGDFQKVDGQLMPALAYLEKEHWSNVGWVDSEVVAHAFGVDGVVRCFEVVDQQLLVGGEFSLTAPMTTHPDIDQWEVNHLASWDSRNWSEGFQGEHSPVFALKNYEGSIYLAGYVDAPNAYGIYTDGEWTYAEGSIFGYYELYVPQGDGLFHDFIVYQDQLYLSGGFEYDIANGIFGSGIVEIYGTSASAAAYFDNTVSAIGIYEDKLVFGGDFTFHNGLTYSVFGGGVATRDVEENKKLKVFQSNDQLLVQYESEEQVSELQFFDLRGQLIHQTSIPRGQGEISISTSAFAAGAYVYQMLNRAYRETGKVVIAQY